MKAHLCKVNIPIEMLNKKCLFFKVTYDCINNHVYDISMGWQYELVYIIINMFDEDRTFFMLTDDYIGEIDLSSNISLGVRNNLIDKGISVFEQLE